LQLAIIALMVRMLCIKKSRRDSWIEAAIRDMEYILLMEHLGTQNAEVIHIRSSLCGARITELDKTRPCTAKGT